MSNSVVAYFWTTLFDVVMETGVCLSCDVIDRWKRRNRLVSLSCSLTSIKRSVSCVAETSPKPLTRWGETSAS